MPEDPKKSKVEHIKESSDYLRGSLKENLALDTDNFPDDQAQLLKFHGIYQQDNRDSRKERIREKRGKEYFMMIRSKFPGGTLSTDQYLMYDEISETLAGGTIRLTTRQTIQLHGVLKKNAKKAMRAINKRLITTLGACGDVVRNVMATPLPMADESEKKVLAFARDISNRFLPATPAYHEVWLNGEKVDHIAAENVEPLYGKTYLPRKFKLGIAFENDNIVDVYTQDIGIVPKMKAAELLGFTILVGGGLGFTHRMEKTYPRLASPLCFIEPEKLGDVCEAIITVQRDYGDRSDRKRARMKYLIDDWGMDKFKKEVERRFGAPLKSPEPIKWKKFSLDEYLGWHALDGGGFYGLSIENGRIKDDNDFRLKSAIRDIARKYQPEIRLTPSQDMLFCGLPAGAEEGVEAILKSHGIKTSGELTQARKLSMACPALPLCPLALGEAERALPKLIDLLEEKLKSLGLEDEKVTVRMTGCPNSCARPQTAEIAFIATQPDTYNIYIAGSPTGERLNRLYKERVPYGKLVDELEEALVLFKKTRAPSESFGDFCLRSNFGGGS